MAESKIEWTDRSDWNPIRGCTRVSPGCGGPGDHGGCYAEQIAGRFSDKGQAFHGFATRTPKGGRWTGKVELVEERIALPLKWRKPATIFPNSTSDIFHEGLTDAQIDMVVVTMAMASWHTFQPLTKRADRMRDYLLQDRSREWAEAADRIADLAGIEEHPWVPEHSDLPFRHIWWGVSVENQEWADKRREDFRAVPSAVKVVSYEPAVGPVDWTGWEFVQQIISGGESGHKARPNHPDWHRDTRDFCATHGIAYFFKQWGEWIPMTAGSPSFRAGTVHTDGRVFSGDRVRQEGDVIFVKIGKSAAGRKLFGVEHNGMPG